LTGEQNPSPSAKDLPWILNENRGEIVSTMSTVCKNHESGREQSRFSGGRSSSAAAAIMKHRPPTSVRPLLPIMVCLLALPLAGQSTLGELRLRVTDPRGSGIETEVQVVSEVNQYDSTLATDDSGVLIAKHLPFGLY
jgi:hypothetical protein